MDHPFHSTYRIRPFTGYHQQSQANGSQSYQLYMQIVFMSRVTWYASSGYCFLEQCTEIHSIRRSSAYTSGPGLRKVARKTMLGPYIYSPSYYRALLSCSAPPCQVALQRLDQISFTQSLLILRYTEVLQVSYTSNSCRILKSLCSYPQIMS